MRGNTIMDPPLFTQAQISRSGAERSVTGFIILGMPSTPVMAIRLTLLS